MTNDNAELFTSAPVSKAVLALAVPTVISQLITVVYNTAETVAYGQGFLRVICLACPTTALNFMIITVFQATNQNVQALTLSFLRKGSIDVVLMLLLNRFAGVNGIPWATPLADTMALCVALCLFVPYLRRSKAEM